MTVFAPILILIGPPTDLKITVNGVERRAVIIAPSVKSEHPPIIFGFHGHGGQAKYAQRSYGIDKEWPEAVVVYPEGLPTKTLNDPVGARNGWEASRTEANKDLKFFDALVERMQKDYHFDPKRVFVMGHSNGGAFTYLLWEMRPKVVTALAPFSAAGALRFSEPKPAFLVMGESDEIVNPRWQKASIDAALRLNKVKSDPKKLDKYILAYSGPNPTTTYIYPGGHKFEAAAVPWMVKFFKGLTK